MIARAHHLLFIPFLTIIFSLTFSGELRAQSPYKKWISKNSLKHKLVGKIWSVADGKFIRRDDLISRLAIKDYVLLGEVHDNPDHHRLQAWIIRNIVRYDRKPAIVMEMIEQDQNDVIREYYKKIREKIEKKPASNLGAELKWEERGWPAWEIYAPIAKVIFAYNLPLSAASPAKPLLKKIKRSGIKSLKARRLKELGLQAKLSLSQSTFLKQILNDAHCNILPYAALAPMADIQQFRDAVFAENVMKAGRIRGAILISGSGHVRNDFAVPYFIKSKEPASSVASLALTEVIAGKNDPASHIPLDQNKKPTVDFLWFTPGKKRPDPCLKFKKNMAQQKEKK